MKFPFLTLFLIVVLVNGRVVAQINIDVKSSVSDHRFQITIDEDEQKYFLTLKIKDSVSLTQQAQKEMKLVGDQLFKLQDKSIRNDTAKHLLEKVAEIIERNTVYSIYNTSILKKEHKDYDHFIEMIKKTSKEELERNRRSKNTFVLDGMWVQTVIKTNRETKAIHIHAPREDSHPEINDLIVNTLSVFRDQNIIANDPYRTAGY